MLRLALPVWGALHVLGLDLEEASEFLLLMPVELT